MLLNIYVDGTQVLGDEFFVEFHSPNMFVIPEQFLEQLKTSAALIAELARTNADAARATAVNMISDEEEENPTKLDMEVKDPRNWRFKQESDAQLKKERSQQIVPVGGVQLRLYSRGMSKLPRCCGLPSYR